MSLISLSQLQDPDPNLRTAIAMRGDVMPEMLYFLAKDEHEDVRAAVAGNSQTPMHAAPLLQQDKSPKVRGALARKLSRALNEGESALGSKNYRIAVDAVEGLMQDQLTEVRAILAESLKDVAMLPPQIAGHLARDINEQVAKPILRFCNAVSDADLVQIIQQQPEGWRLGAIAGRDQISASVSGAIIASGNAEAVGILLDNSGAVIDDAGMDAAIGMARHHHPLQPPLVRRPGLNGAQAKKLAEFVEDALLDELLARRDIPPEVAEDLAKTMARRVQFKENRRPNEQGKARAKRLHKEGQLDDDAVRDAIALKETEFYTEALSLRARIHVQIVKKILSSSSPRAITAMCWRAGLAMRTAIELQKRHGVAPKNVLLAAGGFDYPLSDQEMQWQLEFFGIDPIAV